MSRSNRSLWKKLMLSFSIYKKWVVLIGAIVLTCCTAIFILVNGGGNNGPVTQTNHCPPETVSENGERSDLKAFLIDEHEVTNAEYKACEDAGVCTPPWVSHSSKLTSYHDNDWYGNYPVIYVTWDQAKAYCEWSGARLPTREEWLKSATGISKDEICIDCKDKGYADTKEIESNAKDKNLVGIYDLVGNVFEWGEDASPNSDRSPIFGYSDDSECIRLNPKGAADEWIGFRCVRDPVPAR
jgi:formylglycine-generating enzyme required for sulfatase activity